VKVHVHKLSKGGLKDIRFAGELMASVKKPIEGTPSENQEATNRR
jgi:hypothetical protein